MKWEITDSQLLLDEEEIYLRGCQCKTCGHISFPYRRVCPNCLEGGLLKKPVGKSARLKEWTISCVAPDGFVPPLIQAWVKMDEGPEVFSLLSCPLEGTKDLQVQQKLVLHPIKNGREIKGWGYEPVFQRKGEKK
jgi:uncharacterized OB-fold protein